MTLNNFFTRVNARILMIAVASIAALALIVTTLPVSAASLVGNANLTGQVKTPAGNPVNRATVKLVRDGQVLITETNSDGFFTFSSIASGNYTLVVKKDGFETYRGPVSLPESGTVVVHITLRRL